jgi:MFS family permease
MVFQWHIAGMYAPGFFTGSLIRRFGVLRVIGAGIVLMAAAALVALSGVTVGHFIAALILLGVGWNFMYTGGTALLTESYAPAEKARTQGANDFIVFATMGISSFSSGFLVNRAGWEAMNLGALPVLAVIALAVSWLAWHRRRRRPAAA